MRDADCLPSIAVPVRVWLGDGHRIAVDDRNAVRHGQPVPPPVDQFLGWIPDPLDCRHGDVGVATVLLLRGLASNRHDHRGVCRKIMNRLFIAGPPRWRPQITCEPEQVTLTSQQAAGSSIRPSAAR